MSKEKFLYIMGLTIIFVFLFFSGNTIAKKPLIVSIGSGGMGGTYYPSMAAIAEVISNDVKEIKNATAQITGGSFENVRLLQDGYIQFAIMNAASVYSGHRGTKPFKKKMDRIRTICWAHSSFLHIITLKKSGIKTFEDTIGKRFVVGSTGAGHEIQFQRILEVCGLTYKDFKVEYLNIGAGINALKDGRVDVTLASGSVPLASVMDLAFIKKTHLIEISEEIMDKMIKKYPFYGKSVVPAGTYKGIDKSCKVFISPATISCSVDMPEDVVYKVTKAIYKKIPWLAENIQTAFKSYIFDPSVKRLAPLHPGAIKFYKEIGKMQ